MHLARSCITALLAASAFASPLEKRAGSVTCIPDKKASSVSHATFKVENDKAKAEAKKASFTTGKSGDPHRYGNGDKIKWGVHNCDKAGAILWEFPIFWETTLKDKEKAKIPIDNKTKKLPVEWQKETQTKDQPWGSTPIRAVYSNSNGAFEFCGVMIHAEVDDKFVGKQFFKHCT